MRVNFACSHRDVDVKLKLRPTVLTLPPSQPRRAQVLSKMLPATQANQEVAILADALKTADTDAQDRSLKEGMLPNDIS